MTDKRIWNTLTIKNGNQGKERYTKSQCSLLKIPLILGSNKLNSPWIPSAHCSGVTGPINLWAAGLR